MATIDVNAADGGAELGLVAGGFAGTAFARVFAFGDAAGAFAAAFFVGAFAAASFVGAFAAAFFAGAFVFVAALVFAAGFAMGVLRAGCYPDRMRTAVVAALLVAATTAACSGDRDRGGKLSKQDAYRALVDRNWMDSWPEDKDDRLRLYRFTPSMGGGVYQDRKVFRGQFELFQYQAADGTIDFQFPDTGEQVRAPFVIERVRGPKPFDLRLTIADDPRGPGVYYATSGKQGQAQGPLALPALR